MTVVDLLRQTAVPTRKVGEHHHATHNRIQVDCPWCSPGSGRFRLGISLDGSRGHCWSCGWRPSIEALSILTGMKWADVRELLSGVAVLDQTELPKRGKLEIPDGVGPLLPAHRNYLKQRHLDPDEIENVWKVKGIGQTAKLGWRLWIPAELNGETVSWTARSVSQNSTLRYVTAKPEQESVPLKSLLYGADHAWHAVVVVEGPVDVWRIGPGAVATCGISYTRAQVRKIARFPKRTICYDAEPKAQLKASKLCRELMAFPGVTNNVVLDAKDPGEASERDIGLIRKLFLC